MTMVKKSVGDLTDAELKGKKVLVRCDLNVPLDGKVNHSHIYISVYAAASLCAIAA
jgi:3-phosphoglycerate kinase